MALKAVRGRVAGRGRKIEAGPEEGNDGENGME